MSIPVVEEPPDLFEVGQEAFFAYKAELRRYGVIVDPMLELRRGQGVLCFYRREHNAIYLSVPSRGDPSEPIYNMFMGSLLSAESDEALDEFMRLFVPRVVAHELGHALRDQAELFGDNLWEEEQVANQLAVALQNRGLAPEERAFFEQFVANALVVLVEKVGPLDRARSSYLDQLQAMYAAGEITTSTMQSLEQLGDLLEVEPVKLLNSGDLLSVDAQDGLDDRQNTIEEFNAAYMSNQLHYFYFQLGWLQIDLTARNTRYVDEFAQRRLGVVRPRLPPLRPLEGTTAEAVLACHRAHRQCQGLNPTAARWFYKRYRALLIRLLQRTDLGPGNNLSAAFRDESSFLLEAWTENAVDKLDLMAAVLPPELRVLFPSELGKRAAEDGPEPADWLPDPVDRSLWRHVVRGVPDEAARMTLLRLELIDRAEIFQTLPARVMLDLVSTFVEVKLLPSEPIMWQTDHNSDVFILFDGELEWVAHGADGTRNSGAIPEGEIVGEMAFLTDEPRTATVRATKESACFVIKAADLRRLAHRHPSIMHHIAGALARRLAVTTRQRASAEARADAKGSGNTAA